MSRVPAPMEFNPVAGATRKRKHRLGVLFAFLLVLSACGGGATTTGSTSGSNADDGAAAAAPAPALLSGSFETLDGSQVDLASLEGQDAVLWFWAPW